MRTCPLCKVTKSLDEFQWKSRDKGIRQSRCRECRESTRSQHTPAPTAPCDRCGTVRAIREKAQRLNLCRDCYGVLTPLERKAWERSDLEMSLWMRPGAVLY